MKTLLSIVILLFCYNVSNAQSKETEELRKELQYTHDSLQYTDKLNRLAILYYEINADSIFYYAVEARNVAGRLKYTKGEADALNNLGVLNDLKGNSQDALRYYNKAYNRYRQIHDSSNMVQVIMNIAVVYSEMEKPQKMLDNFKTAFALGKNLKQDSIMSFVFANYVTCFADQLPKDSVQLYLNKARVIAKKYNDIRILLFIDQITAENMVTNHQAAKAIPILEAALETALTNNLYYTATDLDIDLGDITPDSSKAVNYYLQSLDLSQERGFRASVRYAYEKLFDFYENKGNDAASLMYSEKLLYFYNAQKNIDNNASIDYIDYALKDQALTSSLIQSKYERKLLILTIAICILSVGFVIILWNNIRKIKKSAEALKMQFVQSELAMENLDKVNKNHSRVMKVVAHDLRNPISSINIISTLIDTNTMPASEINDFLNMIQMVSQNCFDLIDQLLHTDLEEEQEIQKSEIEVNNMLSQCVQLLNFKAREKNQQIIFSDELHATILGDSNKLIRVINNLVLNAIKFSPEESVITIKTILKGNTLIIAVIDLGIGIPHNLQNKIFDPFTSAKRKGTNGENTFGLGLYISKRIVEAHGGVIWFNSLPGKGTAFYIQLPIENYSKKFDSIKTDAIQKQLH